MTKMSSFDRVRQKVIGSLNEKNLITQESVLVVITSGALWVVILRGQSLQIF